MLKLHIVSFAICYELIIMIGVRQVDRYRHAGLLIHQQERTENWRPINCDLHICMPNWLNVRFLKTHVNWLY